MTENVDVVIIGAGLSGLAAARELIKKGITNIKIVEAQNRVGGRTFTKRYEIGKRHQDVEIGGQWVAPFHKHMNELIKEYKLTLIPQFDEGNHILQLPNDKITYNGNISTLKGFQITEIEQVWDTLNKLSAEIDLEKPMESKDAKLYDSMTVNEWLNKNLTDENTKKFVKWFIGVCLTSEAHELSFLYFLMFLKSSGGYENLVNIKDGAQDSFIKGGSQQIAKKMAKDIGHSKILIDSPVISIKYSDNKVSVIYMKQKTLSMIKAKRCIIAVSPNLAGRIQYDPPLPNLRDQLTQRMPGGSVYKIHIYYKKNFWKKGKFSGEVISLKGPIALMYDKSYDGLNCLVAFSAGAIAREWSKKSKEERKQETLTQISEVFETKEALSPANYIEMDWAAEKYSRGCFVKGTKVLMWDGNKKNIEDIKIDDEVLGPDSKPRKVVELIHGRDIMYKIMQKTNHTNDHNYGIIEFECNSRHLLVVETPKFVGSINQRKHSRSGCLMEHIEYFDLSEIEVENKKIQMVKLRIKTFLHREYGEEIAKKKMLEFRNSILEKNGNETTFKWLIEAKDVDKIETKVRVATFQNWAPILIEKNTFRNCCINLKIKEENIGKIAWLLGLWVGDGYSTAPKISVNINDKDEIKRIQDYCEDLDLVASEPHQSKKKKKDQNLGGEIYINSSRSLGENGKNYFKQFNVFWDMITSYFQLGKSTHKSIPKDFHLEEIFVREWFLAGLIDADGHLCKTNNCVYIATIYDEVRDGLIKLSRSLGIRVSISTKLEYIDKFGQKHQTSHHVRLTMCSALQHILSKCSISGEYTSIGGSTKKKMDKPEKVEYLNQPFYFTCEKVEETIIKKKKIDVENLSDSKIRSLMKDNKKFGYTLGSMAHLSEVSKELDKISYSSIGAYLDRSTNSIKSRNVCIYILKENKNKIENELNSKRITIEKEYFGFTLQNGTDHLFLLDNNIVCHNCYFCVATPGTFSECGDSLRKPIGPIHFAASETSINYFGYMEGALDSGIRAANEVYQVMNIKSKL